MFFRKSPKRRGTYLLQGDLLYVERPEIELSLELTDDDLLQQKRILDWVEIWAIHNGFILNRAPILDKAVSHLPTRIFHLDFRTLVVGKHLDDLVDTLKDTSHDMTTTRILALHTLIMSLSDLSYLTKFVNKLYHALDLTGPQERDQSWPEIHGQFPYLWVLWLIQTTMHLQPNRAIISPPT